MKRFFSSSCITIVALLTFGCAKAPAPSAPENQPGTPNHTPELTNSVPESMLPVSETRREKLGNGKADQYTDFRDKYISYFRVTQPPTIQDVKFPGEFEPMAYLAVGWIPGTLDKFFMEIILGTWGVTPVMLVAPNSGARDSMKQTIAAQLTAANMNPAEVNDESKLKIVIGNLGSIWMRDYGPQPVIHKGTGKVSIIDTRYYHQRVYDDSVPGVMANDLGINIFRPDIKQEGGNFLANGEGYCFTSAGTLFARNSPEPNPNKLGHDDLYKKYFGCKSLTIVQPLEGEGTTHIDMFMAIIGPNDIVVGEHDKNVDCINAETLEKNVEMIKAIKGDDGKPKFRIHRIPMPPNHDGIWRTYTNFQMVRNLKDPTKGVILLPVYKDYPTLEAKMESALNAALKIADPNTTWKLVKINSDDIITWQGAIHCVVHEFPKGTYSKQQNSTTSLCGDTKYSCGSPGCGEITNIGVCMGNNLAYCNNGHPSYITCGIPCHVRDADVKDGYLPQNYPCEMNCGMKDGINNCIDTFECKDDTLGCNHECNAGQTGCGDDGKSTFICGEANDGDNCREKIVTACTGDQVCSNGKCQDPGTDPCNGVDYNGYCDGTKVIWCEENQLWQYDCTARNLTCGETSQGIADCVSGGTTPCTDECQLNEKGCEGNKAWVCQQNRSATCMVKVFTDCGSGTCSDGICSTPTCTSTCNAGEKGCESNTTAWTCEKGTDGCYSKKSAPCVNGTCNAGVCQPTTPTCTDQCQLGTTGCSDWNVLWTCVQGSNGCAVKQASTCTTGICNNGACIDNGTNPQPDTSVPNNTPDTVGGNADGKTTGEDNGSSGSCQVSANRPGDTGAALLLFCLLFGLVLRRRSLIQN